MARFAYLECLCRIVRKTCPFSVATLLCSCKSELKRASCILDFELLVSFLATIIVDHFPLFAPMS